MSMYGETNYEMNDLYDAMRDFLQNHDVSELLKIVKDAVEYDEDRHRL